jgi:hypothetical protein
VTKKPRRANLSRARRPARTNPEDVDWHRRVTDLWFGTGIGFAHDESCSIDDTAGKLSDKYAEQRGLALGRWNPKRHVLRKLTLDLICNAFPAVHPPPPGLVRLMKHALDLPQSHQVGNWTYLAGHRDDRGDADHEMRDAARRIDVKYFYTHDEKLMPIRELARRVKEKMNRPVDRKSLRDWRTEWLPWLLSRQGGGK